MKIPIRTRRRALVALVAAALTGGGVAATAPSTASQTSATAPPVAASTAGAQSIELERLEPGTHRITLITGDTVTLSPSGGGQFGIETVPGAGRSAEMLTRHTPEGTYVFPLDVLPAVDAGRVDRDLFNVTYLAGNGYTDADMKQLPLIAQYPSRKPDHMLRTTAAALPASTPGVTLESINANRLNVSKANAGRFWQAVSGGQAQVRTLRSGIDRLWLDQKVHVNLDESVPLIGAPEAWGAGLDGTGITVAVLDTGIDANHPDLEGKVVASQSFIPGVDSVQDGHGHGTHVASTITGSGVASDGQYTGVAPGTDLAVGKVLSDGGSGSDSGVIEGMEWAAQEVGADIVSMSLGSGPTDGTDPASLAVNSLTASTRTLFVIAAGNSGPATQTVDAPGAASAALTVAATTKDDALAAFSSRGPRLDGALKPDIAAPGQNIGAARAAGTDMCGPTGCTIPGDGPINEFYYSVSGTSMATPHVAAAAAILAQQHPDWTPERLKAALMSTSTDAGYIAYEQGAGRLDVARAISQQVVATTPNIDYRYISGDNPAPVDQTVTYANHGHTDVTLTLATTLASVGGTPADDVMSAPGSVTVPAGGTATVTVTADAAALDIGNYTGALVGTADGIQVRTPVGLVREPERYDLVVHTIGRDGQPSSPWYQETLDVAGEQGYAGAATLTGKGETTIRVAPGTYSITQLMDWIDEGDRHNRVWLPYPEVTVTGDTEITLDARTASEITFDTPKPTGVGHGVRWPVKLQRGTATGESYVTQLAHLESHRLWAVPTDEVETGTFWFKISAKLAPSELTMDVAGRRGLTLDPLYAAADSPGTTAIRHFEGARLHVVDVRLGRPGDIAGLDLTGKLALMEVGLAEDVFGQPACGIRQVWMEAIRDAGAAGILAFPTDESNCPIPLPVAPEQFTAGRPTGIPFASVSTREGLALRAANAERPVTIRTAGAVPAPYSYNLTPYEDGRIPESLHYRFTDDELARIDLTLQSPLGPDSGHVDSLNVFRSDERGSVGSSPSHTGATRTEYIGPLADDVFYYRHVQNRILGDNQGAISAAGEVQVFDRPVTLDQRYVAGPRLPGAKRIAPQFGQVPTPVGTATCVICRQADKLYPQLIMASVSNGLSQADNFNSSTAVEDWRDFALSMTRDSTPVPVELVAGIPTFTLPAEDGQYELVADGPNTDATWTFDSTRPTQNELAPGYRCDHGILFGIRNEPCRAESVLFAYIDLGDTVDTANRVAASRPHRFELTVGNPQTPTAPEVTEARLWVSTDDGETWEPRPLERTGNGTYTVNTSYPKLSDTSGAVSLKIEAADADGNTLEMTSLRAFELR